MIALHVTRLPLTPFRWPDDVIRRAVEQGLYLLARITGKAATYGRKLKLEHVVFAGEIQELIHKPSDDTDRKRFKSVPLGRYGIAIPLNAMSLTIYSAAMLPRP